jgi:hypothetical protein
MRRGKKALDSAVNTVMKSRMLGSAVPGILPELEGVEDTVVEEGVWKKSL